MRVPILMYHQVMPDPPDGFRKYCVVPRAFDAQMRWLARMRYTTVSLDAVLAAHQGRSRLPNRPVVITFDDGFRDCVESVVPILGKYHLTATFFLVAGLMGRTSEWLRRERGVEFDLVNWNQARQLHADGFQCGAHSLTHPHLTELSENDCRRELSGARSTLEQELGTPVHHVAYPFGAWNARVQVLAAEAGYRSACSVEIGLATESDSPFALRRVPVTGYDSLSDFAWRLETGWPWREWVRGKLGARPVRRAGGARSA